jgi:hypothetical protein
MNLHRKGFFAIRKWAAIESEEHLDDVLAREKSDGQNLYEEKH